MDMNFILIQLIGVLAWIFLFLSFYRKNTDKILIFQVIASLLYCVHYYFLNAYSGLLMCLISAIFDFAYYKSNNDKYLYLMSIPLRIIAGFISYSRIVDILPIVASLLDGYILTKEKKTLLIGSVIYYVIWIIYNVNVASYSGVITDGILVISNLSILLFNFNILNKKDKSGDALKR
ncbi:MAG: YgjV family protein [Bacilli bacterium]|nr:YgjV family protein [Bacilli bacterium]